VIVIRPHGSGNVTTARAEALQKVKNTRSHVSVKSVDFDSAKSLLSAQKLQLFAAKLNVVVYDNLKRAATSKTFSADPRRRNKLEVSSVQLASQSN
jgi:hypothetical protein